MTERPEDPFILEMQFCEQIGAMAGIVSRMRVAGNQHRMAAEELREQLDTVYEERARLVAFLAAVYPSWWADDPEAPGYRVIMVDTPTGQMSWHIAARDLDLFRDCRVAPDGPTYDGHTTATKYVRLGRLVTRVEPWDWQTYAVPPVPTSPAGTGAISGRTGQMFTDGTGAISGRTGQMLTDGRLVPDGFTERLFTGDTQTDVMPRLEGP